MSWVMPKPTPAQKLQRVSWEEQDKKPPNSLQHLRELCKREKKVLLCRTIAVTCAFSKIWPAFV